MSLWHRSNRLSPRCLLSLHQLWHVSSSGEFFFRVEPPIDSLCCMLVLSMVFAFCFQVLMLLPCSQWGLNCWGLQCCNPMEYTLGRNICLLVMVNGPTRIAQSGSYFHCFQFGEASCSTFSCIPAIPSIWLGIQFIHLSAFPS